MHERDERSAGRRDLGDHLEPCLDTTGATLDLWWETGHLDDPDGAWECSWILTHNPLADSSPILNVCRGSGGYEGTTCVFEPSWVAGTRTWSSATSSGPAARRVGVRPAVTPSRPYPPPRSVPDRPGWCSRLRR